LAADKRKLKNALPRYLEVEEVAALLDACPNPRDRMLCELLWRTGGRISEVLRIRPLDISSDAIRLVTLKQRGMSERSVIIADPVFIGRLREYARGVGRNHYLFPGSAREPGDVAGHLTRQRAWQLFKRASLLAQIYKPHVLAGLPVSAWPHTMRHSHAAHLIEGGVPINSVQAQLGHSDLASTAVYLRIADKERRRQIAQVQF
jgi:integrase/recombinase XerD